MTPEVRCAVEKQLKDFRVAQQRIRIAGGRGRREDWDYVYRMQAALDVLDETQRRVVEAVYLDHPGRPLQEVAGELSISLVTLHRHKTPALKLLAEVLGIGGEE